METLSGLFKCAIEGNYLYGSKVIVREGEELVISHLLYADDTLIFSEVRSTKVFELDFDVV